MDSLDPQSQYRIIRVWILLTRTRNVCSRNLVLATLIHAESMERDISDIGSITRH